MPHDNWSELLTGYCPEQFEESAIAGAIDDIGLQHIAEHVVAAPSPLPSSSSSDDDASSISDDVPVAPIGRTSDYSSSSEEDVDADAASEHFDFMEAAVTVAIQKKGLLPQSIDMSPNR